MSSDAAPSSPAAVPQPKISELLGKPVAPDTTRGNINVSFEFFPPRSEAADAALHALFPVFQAQKPIFMDMTWGAGGTTSDKTQALCKAMKENHDIIVNMHLTCTNMPETKVHEALEFCKTHGIRNLVALRGDPPAGQKEWQVTEGGFACALDLVRYVRATYGDYFCIAVAGYPEGHPTVIDPETGFTSDDKMAAEISYLKQKIDAGGDYIITQLFYDNGQFLRFQSQCRAAGIACPILPGMLPPVSYAGLQRMLTLCKTHVPAALMAEFEEAKASDEKFKAFGVELTTRMIREMMSHGVSHFHFYTLNSDVSTFAVMRNLGLLL